MSEDRGEDRYILTGEVSKLKNGAWCLFAKRVGGKWDGFPVILSPVVCRDATGRMLVGLDVAPMPGASAPVVDDGEVPWED